MTAKHTFRDYVNFRLERVSRIAREAADKVYLRHFGLDILHIRVLRLVAEKPRQAVNAIVRESMLERSLVSRMVSRLVKQKLIRRTISAADARQVLLEATPVGSQLVRAANALGDDLNLDLLHVLDAHEIDVFDQCLAKLATWRPKNEDARAAKPRPRQGAKRLKKSAPARRGAGTRR